jgi:hypothetical protein
MICIVYYNVIYDVDTYEHYNNEHYDKINTYNIGIQDPKNKQICWLTYDKSSKANTGYPQNIYPITLQCTDNSDHVGKFTIDKSTNNLEIYTNILNNNKKCNLIYTQEGPNQGFGYYNLALSCDPKYNEYNNFIKKYNRLHPTKRNKCYLINKDSRPLFYCHSTPLSALLYGNNIVFK